MSRKNHASTRRSILTETEAALDWELRRARAELAILRKAKAEPDDGGGELDAAGIAVLVRRIGTMVRNSIPSYLRPDDACTHCGGSTVPQIEAAFEAWADAEERCGDSYDAVD